jgi:hypothetical protein
MEGNLPERKLPVLTVAALMKSLRATAPTRIPVTARVQGRFLESRLPIRAIATLTTQMRASQIEFDDSFHQWMRGVQAHNRMTVGWIRTYEDKPQRHVHVVLVAAAPLDFSHAASLWRTIAAPQYKQAAVVKPYVGDVCGVGYVVKELDASSEDAQFSDNLVAFALGYTKSMFRTTSAHRRQCKRIKAQLSTRNGGIQKG